MHNALSASEDVIGASISWMQNALSGSIATAIATLAIATVGILLLQGRLEFRRAGQVILGCFLIFGASTLASGIPDWIQSDGQLPQTQATPTPPPMVAQTVPAQPFDPYAGAALPSR